MAGSKISKVATPKKGQYDYYFLASDWHSHHLSQSSYSILKQHAKIVPKQSRKLVIVGDFMDCEHLMGKPHELRKTGRDTDRLESDIIPKTEAEFLWANETLDELQKIFSEIIFVEGNHDWRYRNFIKNYVTIPYRHNFDYEFQLDLKARGIKTIYYNDYLDIGELSITHGMFHGRNHNTQHFMATTRNIIYGHVHHHNCTSFFHRGNARKAWSLPAMCELNPIYIKNRDVNWSNGYAFVAMKPNGNFNLHIHEVFDNELILPNGKLLRH
jgi:hypothetical protein